MQAVVLRLGRGDVVRAEAARRWIDRDIPAHDPS
jgi:hypothetical protein